MCFSVLFKQTNVIIIVSLRILQAGQPGQGSNAQVLIQEPIESRVTMELTQEGQDQQLVMEVTEPQQLELQQNGNTTSQVIMSQ